MKKIYDSWRNDVLNEFAPSYGIEDEEVDIEQYMTPSSDLIQNAIQDAIDSNKGLHASGRPINPNLLQGLLKENDAKELIDSMRGLREDDYLRKLTLSPPHFENATGRLNDITSIYNAALRSEGNSIAVADVPLKRYMDNLFMDTKRFQEFKENINNATEAFGLLLNSNRYDIVHAIRLFTGESVSTVRKPPEFDSTLAQPMEKSRINKKKVLEKLLPDIAIKGPAIGEFDPTDYNIFQSFHSIINHCFRGASTGFIGRIEQIHSSEGKEKLTAYFDKVIEIAKSEFTKPEMRIRVYQKKGFVKMSEMVGYSTKSKKFQEFLGSIDRIKSMIPTYQRFLEHHTNFLSTPEQEDYEVAKNILIKLAKKPSKYNFRVYRGMYIKGSLFPEGIKEGMEFDFHDLSSWSREQNVAMNFSTTSPDGKREAGDKSVIFTMTMKRGTYIDYYSAYDGEEEVITGGKVKIVEVTKMEKMQGTILRVLCEQI
jgi:hypothetical protein